MPITPEEGQEMYWWKHCMNYKNKNDFSCLNKPLQNCEQKCKNLPFSMFLIPEEGQEMYWLKHYVDKKGVQIMIK